MIAGKQARLEGSLTAGLAVEEYSMFEMGDFQAVVGQLS